MSRPTWTFGSLLKLVCPVCGSDTFKAGLFRTSRRCSRCGQDFEPEPGFFAGAIYPMYGMGALVGGSVGLVAAFRDASLGSIVLWAALAMACCSPWIFWFARLGFLYTNHRFFKDQH